MKQKEKQKLHHELNFRIVEIEKIINQIGIEQGKEDPNYKLIFNMIAIVKKMANFDLADYIKIKNFN